MTKRKPVFERLHGAEIARQLDDSGRRALLFDLQQLGEEAVAGAVVDEDQLQAQAEIGELAFDSLQLGEQVG